MTVQQYAWGTLARPYCRIVGRFWRGVHVWRADCGGDGTDGSRIAGLTPARTAPVVAPLCTLSFAHFRHLNHRVGQSNERSDDLHGPPRRTLLTLLLLYRAASSCDLFCLSLVDSPFWHILPLPVFVRIPALGSPPTKLGLPFSERQESQLPTPNLWNKVRLLLLLPTTGLRIACVRAAATKHGG